MNDIERLEKILTDLDKIIELWEKIAETLVSIANGVMKR